MGSCRLFGGVAAAALLLAPGAALAQDASAALEARIAQLEAQNFNTNLANNAAQQNRNDMQSMLKTILAHLPTTSSGGTASR